MSSSRSDPFCISMSPQVKPAVFTVAHKQPLSPLTYLPHHPPSSISSSADHSPKLLKQAGNCLTPGPFTGPYFAPNALPQRSTWLPHLPPSSQLQSHLMKEAFPDHSLHLKQHQGFLGGRAVKSAYKAGCMGSIPDTVRSHIPRGN